MRGGASGGGIFTSTNNGKTWSEAYAGLTVQSLAVDLTRWHIFAGVTRTVPGLTKGVYISENGGTSWTAVTWGLTNTDVYSLAVNQTNGYVFAGTPGGVFLLKDKDSSWTQVSSGLSNTTVRSLAINSNGYILAGTSSRGVFISTNNGTSWTEVNSGLSNRYVSSLAINSYGYIFAATAGSGVFRSVRTTTAVEEIAGEMPGSFHLAQNYPNPFNPSTTIEFSIPHSAQVILKVHNALGEEVATLVDQNLHAGKHRVEWNAKGISSGVYFYRLYANGFVQTKKLVLMR